MIRHMDGKNWQLIADLKDLPKQGAKSYTIGDRSIGIFRTFHNQIFAIHDQCPHKQGPLSEGLIHGKYVTCPLHDWTIDLQSGSCQSPDEGQVACYPLLIDGDEIWISLE